MNIYLLRHGRAEEPSAAIPDGQRALTAEGRRKLGKIGRAMNRMDLRFDLILSSPLVRSMQTAEIVSRILTPRVEVQTCPALRSGGPIAQILKALKDLPAGASEILLVGHEPTLSQWISELTFGKAGASIHLKKGGISKLTVGELRPRGFATLEWLLTPGQMELMSGTCAK